MHLFRFATSIYGDSDVVIGASWDLLPWFAAAGDIRDGWRSIRQAIGGAGSRPGKPGKYKILQKLYHLAAALFILSIIASGLLMLLKIDTPLWRRDPYWFDPGTWGVIYFVHG